MGGTFGYSGNPSYLGSADHLRPQVTGFLPGANASRLQDYNATFGGYSDLSKSPGYSEQEKSDILQSGMGGVTGAFNTARDRLSNYQAATGNTAGYGANMGDLARSEATARANVGTQDQVAFANEKQRRQLLGLQGLTSLYGIDTGFLSNLLGDTTSIQNTVKNKETSLLSQIGQGLGIGAQVGAGMFP